MHYVMSAIGGLAVIVLIATSMLMNWRYGFGQGSTEFEGHLLGAVSVGFDLLKVVAAWKLSEFLGDKRFAKAAVAAVLLFGTTLWALQSAIGFSSETRSITTGSRDSVHAALKDAEHELKEKEEQRVPVKGARAVGVVEAEIATQLSTVVKTKGRVLGSVDELSSGCKEIDARTSDACTKVAALRQELAQSIESVRLEKRVAELRQKIEGLRDRGGANESNPLAGFFSRVTRGWLSVADVVMGQSIYLAMLLELCAAFGLVVVFDGGHVRTALEKKTHAENEERDASHSDADVSPERFLAEAMVRAAGASAPRSQLYASYKKWCGDIGGVAIAPELFAERFVAACDASGLMWTTKDGQPHVTGVDFAGA